MSLHRIRTHPEFVEGCFGCKVGTLEMGTGDANSAKVMSEKKWNAELEAYRKARDEGIQPAGTSMAKIRSAVELSDKAGKAFDANTGSFKG